MPSKKEIADHEASLAAKAAKNKSITNLKELKAHLLYSKCEYLKDGQNVSGSFVFNEDGTM